MAEATDRELYDALSFALAVDGLIDKSGDPSAGAHRDIFESIAMDGFAIDRVEAINFVSSYRFALRKESPAKLWWDSDFENRAPVYRALRINPTDFAAAYAIAPFRLRKNDDGQWRILAAYPALRDLEPIDMDWLGIEAVIEWCPQSDTAVVVGDVAPQIVGNMRPEWWHNDVSGWTPTLYASPRSFFQAWAIRRAQFAMQRSEAREKKWYVTPTERDEVPGALLIGDLAKVRLSPSAMPEHIETVGIDPKDLNRAIMRAARLPRASASASHLRSAA